VRRGYVLDTNVVVSSLRSYRGASRHVLIAALRGDFDLLLSVPFLEYEAVLKRPEHLAASQLQASDVEMLLNDLASVARGVNLALRSRPLLSDPSDDVVLETVINGEARAIV